MVLRAALQMRGEKARKGRVPESIVEAENRWREAACRRPLLTQGRRVPENSLSKPKIYDGEMFVS